MMYSEFVENTKCKETEYNYNIFLDIEKLYMDSNMTKEEAYKLGKKLVDNSKSEEELKLEAEITEQIAAEQKEVDYWNERADFYLNVMEDKKGSDYFRNRAKEHKANIKRLKFVLA